METQWVHVCWAFMAASDPQEVLMLATGSHERPSTNRSVVVTLNQNLEMDALDIDLASAAYFVKSLSTSVLRFPGSNSRTCLS